MTKEDVNVAAVRAQFLEDRQKKIDAERAKNKVEDDRTEYGNGFNNPPAVRGTDGLPPSEPEQNPIQMGEQADVNADDAGEVTENSTVAEIKAELDARGIDYNGVTKKADLFALLG